jgi:hypothetical protein
MAYRSEEEKLPILFFLLENHKTHELVKLMLNRILSADYLAQYGQQETPKLKKVE